MLKKIGKQRKIRNWLSNPYSAAFSYLVMMTSSSGNIFRITGHLSGNSPVPGEFPTQRPVTRSFDVSFDLRLNIRRSKQSWGSWCETLSRSLWRHCNGCGRWDNWPNAGVAVFFQILLYWRTRQRHFDTLFGGTSRWIFSLPIHRMYRSNTWTCSVFS